MIKKQSLSEWYKELWEKIDKDLNLYTNRMRKNKEMLINKWTDFYLKKFKKKYMFNNINEVKIYLDKNIDWYCDYLEDDTYNDDPEADDFIFDPQISKKIWVFERDFHEILYDLEKYDPAVEIEKMRNQEKTKSVKNKFVTKLINALNIRRKK